MNSTTKNLVGLTAVVAPLLHAVSDVLEWRSGGFSSLQLYINLAGFLPMPLIIVGLYRLARRQMGSIGLAGALLYAAAFVYFTYSTVHSIYYHVPDYEDLWHRLGWVYTLAGGMMVAGGLMFAATAWKGRAYSKISVGLFGLGLMINLIVAFLPVPEMVQIAGSMFRNAGLIGMGLQVLSGTPGASGISLRRN